MRGRGTSGSDSVAAAAWCLDHEYIARFQFGAVRARKDLPRSVGAFHPLQTGRSVVTAFQSVSMQRPDDDVIAPKPSPDSGFTTTDAPDVIGALGRLPMPQTLAGRPLQTDRVGGGQGLGFYGTGLSAFVVVPLPRDVSGGVVNAIGKGGGKTVTLPGGQGTVLTISPLSVLVERSYRRSYLLAGVVDPALLTQAAAELSTLPGRRP